MNTPSRTRVNGDPSADLSLTGGTATSDAPQAAAGGNAAAAAAAAPVAVPKPQARPEKALHEPDEAFALPRDKYHGMGGLFGVIDGKRVPIDEDGKPLPLDANGMPLPRETKK